MIGVQNIYAPENIRLVHYLEESVKAQALFHARQRLRREEWRGYYRRRIHGRLLVGRRYQAGLHQAIEAKEGVTVKARIAHVRQSFHPELFPHV